MSTDLYGIRVLALDGTVLTFRLFNVYGDQTSLPGPAQLDFFVRLAADSSPRYEESPLRAVLGESQWNEPWLEKNAANFVSGVTVLETANYPGKMDYAFYYERDGGWVDEQRLPQAVYRATYRDAAHIRHFQVGDTWGTTAYGVSWLERTGGEEGLEARLEHRDARLVRDELERLARLGPAARDAVAPIGRRLTDRDPSISIAAAKALGAIATDAAISVLVMSLAGSGGPVTRAILEALTRIGPPAYLATDVLGILARGPQVGLRAGAALALCAIHGDSGPVEPVERALRGSTKEREDVLDALESLPPHALGRLAAPLAGVLLMEKNLPFFTDVLLLLSRAGAAAAPALPALRQFSTKQHERPAYRRLAESTIAAITA